MRDFSSEPRSTQNGIINQAFSKSEENIIESKIRCLHSTLDLSAPEIQCSNDKRGKQATFTVKINQGICGKIGIKLVRGMCQIDEERSPDENGIFVQCVRPGSPSEGKLMPKDRIIAINGVDLTNLSLRTAEQHLKKSAASRRHVTLTVERSESNRVQCQTSTESYNPPEINLKQHWLQELEAVFNVYASHDHMRKRDFFKALRLFGYELPEPEVHLYMADLGLLGSRKLTFQDFVKLMSEVVTEEEHGRELMEIFGMHQVNGRGASCECGDMERTTEHSYA
ncbi:uncharacterized protein LOC116616072 [Nematostella vectensis]|uniref:uncharacterized protein LOC116616072 n=1 Tax=Nematostella vectensis TaxID=45351 RepID=UPI00207794BA|nr:uncharacterized protein LOC116616072 [Nematostella vectensis]